MAKKTFSVEFETEKLPCAIEAVDIWDALREKFVEEVYITVNENAEHSVHLTALRRWSGASFLLNIILLIVLAYIIGGR